MSSRGRTRARGRDGRQPSQSDRFAAFTAHQLRVQNSTNDDDSGDDNSDSRAPSPKRIRHRHYGGSSPSHLTTSTSYVATTHDDSSDDMSPEPPALLLNDAIIQQHFDNPEYTPEYSTDATSVPESDVSDSETEDGPRAARPSDDPLGTWKETSRALYLSEMIRLEGRGDHMARGCANCSVGNPSYRCAHCLGGALLCKNCIVSAHSHLPLHCIKHWDGLYFQSVTLKSLGLRIQLGHPPGICCDNPQATTQPFFVLDVDRYHDVAVDFCDCGSSLPHATQLLRFEWFPATTVYPQTAATFRALEHFQMLSFESKCSAHQFYNTILRQTDNTGVEPPTRYKEFLRMVREWRNLKLLKRAGRGHALDGITTTQPGECAIKCPACPQPGINLPEGWDMEPPEKGWIYTLFTGLDGNFKMKRKVVSSEARDSGLNDGTAFFGDSVRYREHLTKHWDQKQEKSTCVSHDAVNKPDKEVHGTAASGVGTVDCTRHNMKLPLGVGDLQKGERYLNMDYMLFSALQGRHILRLVVSYDIACQWHIHLRERMQIFDSKMHFYPDTVVVYLIPKFHLPAHIEACNIGFSFNLTKWVGRTDGEAPERGWADINPLAASTKEMGPGHRRDTLDDHFNDWNWKKIVVFAELFLNKIRPAVPNRAFYAFDFKEFEAAQAPEDVAKWEQEMTAWDDDKSRPNPFKSTLKTTSLSHVRLQLATEASTDGPEVVIHQDIHPTVMIIFGMDLERQQRTLKNDNAALGLHSTTIQKANIRERINKLRRQIENWMVAQEKYMPAVALRRSAAPTPLVAIPPYDVSLWLPSAVCVTISCSPALQLFEFRLREGQAHDALHDMRHELRVYSSLYKDKDRHASGVHAHTRANTKIAETFARAKLAGVVYTTAREAMLALSTSLELDDTWKHTLRVLNPVVDIRPLGQGVHGDPTGSSSWIWMVKGSGVTAEGDVGDYESRRLEWARQRARAMRWFEETTLLQEEMRRILETYKWNAEQWRERGSSTVGQDEAEAEGLRAYAESQAAVYTSLRARTQRWWENVDEYVAGKLPSPDCNEQLMNKQRINRLEREKAQGALGYA